MEQGINLILARGFADIERAIEVTNTSVTLVDELSSSHEEADQRLLLHTVYISSNKLADRTVIWANDTELFCLGFYFSSTKELKPVRTHMDFDNHVNLSHLSDSLGKEKCILLPFCRASLDGM